MESLAPFSGSRKTRRLLCDSNGRLDFIILEEALRLLLPFHRKIIYRQSSLLRDSLLPTPTLDILLAERE